MEEKNDRMIPGIVFYPSIPRQMIRVERGFFLRPLPADLSLSLSSSLFSSSHSEPTQRGGGEEEGRMNSLQATTQPDSEGRRGKRKTEREGKERTKEGGRDESEMLASAEFHARDKTRERK